MAKFYEKIWNFHYTPNAEKGNDIIFKKYKKTILGAFLCQFYPILTKFEFF